MRKLNLFVSCLITMLLYSCASFAQNDSSSDSDVAEKWIAEWGEKWYERYHPDVDAQYPGGRSNLYHDQYVQDALRNLKDQAWVDWQITNRHYFYDKDWFIVEWFYQSTQESTGITQVESTLAFGRIEDDRLITWIEYFDDRVGEYQAINAMRRFDKEKEVPFPWPENTALRKKYRP